MKHQIHLNLIWEFVEKTTFFLVSCFVHFVCLVHGSTSLHYTFCIHLSRKECQSFRFVGWHHLWSNLSFGRSVAKQLTMATSDSEATESDSSDTAPLRPLNQLTREQLQHRPTEHHTTTERPEGREDTLSMRAVIEEFRKRSMQAVEPPTRDMTPPLPPRKATFSSGITNTEPPVMNRPSHFGLASNTHSRQRTSQAIEIHDDSTDTDEEQRAKEIEFIRQRRLASTVMNRHNTLKKGIAGERHQILTRPQQERRLQPREHASSLLLKRVNVDMDPSSPTIPTVTESSKRPYPSSCSEAGDETESDTETTRLLRRLYWRIDHLEKERAEQLERDQGYQTQILKLTAKVTQLEAHLDKARMVILGPGSIAAHTGNRLSALPEASSTTSPKQTHSPKTSSSLPALGQFEK